MLERCSVAEAQRSLRGPLRSVAAGSEVLLTHGGRPVAVLISVERYASLQLRAPSFAAAFAEHRAKFPRGAAGLGQRQVRSLRYPGGGREVQL